MQILNLLLLKIVLFFKWGLPGGLQKLWGDKGEREKKWTKNIICDNYFLIYVFLDVISHCISKSLSFGADLLIFI